MYNVKLNSLMFYYVASFNRFLSPPSQIGARVLEDMLGEKLEMGYLVPAFSYYCLCLFGVYKLRELKGTVWCVRLNVWCVRLVFTNELAPRHWMRKVRIETTSNCPNRHKS